MGKRQGFRVSLVLMIASVFIFSFSHFGSMAYGSLSLKADTFPENTFIGTVDVAGKTESEAKRLLTEKTETWRSNSSYELVYKEKSIVFNLANFVFNIDHSVASAHSGNNNPLDVKLVPGSLDEILGELSPNLVEKRLDEGKLAEDMLQKALKLEPGKTVYNLDKVISSEGQRALASAAMQLSEEDYGAEEFASSFPSVKIEPFSQFSVQNMIKEAGLNLSPNVLGALASGIYKTILPTNFTVVERHISSELPGYAEAGFEVRVDIGRELDFVFFNPNQSSYVIDFKWEKPELHVILKGEPFLHKYSVDHVEKQEFSPKTIKQYNPRLTAGQKTVKEEGKAGLLIKVKRDIYDEKEVLIETQTVSEDFYPPVHRVEIHPLDPVSNEPAVPGSGTAITIPEAGQKSLPSTGQVGDTAPVVPAQGSSGIPASTDPAPNVPGTYQEDRFWGKPNEQPK
ncbi:G5 domain-containing protein [Bacillus sp. T33-2]|uniref:G5 domain-containing protein n=1 Tax=Bacillus sp. T33-2 TaxID=2054168 RepID=UPI000C77C80A|nr:G5 domain-containing protein [Bacillus sp. T33-2]PLR93707.1 hypothetical protein CVD19_18420 [Bacillus sp. T33-2]